MIGLRWLEYYKRVPTSNPDESVFYTMPMQKLQFRERITLKMVYDQNQKLVMGEPEFSEWTDVPVVKES